MGWFVKNAGFFPSWTDSDKNDGTGQRGLVEFPVLQGISYMNAFLENT